MKTDDFLDNYLDYVIVDEENERFYFDWDDMEIILVDLLNLAAENAKITREMYYEDKAGKRYRNIVDKDSIINTLDNDLE